MKQYKNLLLTGGAIGAISSFLSKSGNPDNMGFCIACFLRDISGALGFHQAGVVQFIRPEIIGLILGAFIASYYFKENRSTGGSSPATRFLLGIVVMIGALLFLGCPLRMVLRLAGGDLNAVIGLIGFSAGIGIGILCLNNGFTLKRAYKQNRAEGFPIVLMAIGLFALLMIAPSFINFSESGPGSMAAPIAMTLAAGLAVGFFAQRTRLCMVGGIRDAVLFKDFTLLSGFLSILVAATVVNIAFGQFNLSFHGQPVAHTEWLWNFIGMVIVGWGSVLLGGCPLRQLILAGEGNSDSTVTVLGLMVGAAIVHNFGLAGSPAGVPMNGKIAGIIVLVLLAGISLFHREKIKA